MNYTKRIWSDEIITGLGCQKILDIFLPDVSNDHFFHVISSGPVSQYRHIISTIHQFDNHEISDL
jgi:hypothetical protein